MTNATYWRNSLNGLGIPEEWGSMMAKQETETSPFQTTSMQLKGQLGKLSKPTSSGIFPARPNIPKQRRQLGSKCSVLGSMGWHSPSNHQTSLLGRLIPLKFCSISIFLESLIFLNENWTSFHFSPVFYFLWGSKEKSCQT